MVTYGVQSYLTREEMKQLTTASDWRGLWALCFNWGLIYACFIAVAWRPNVGMIALALILIGGRQLGLGILMHDAAHFGLFRSKFLNRFCGQWFCAMPMFLDLDAYRRYHFRHHRTAGTSQDPDRPNYLPYPVSKRSFLRKMFRDLSGITGVKTFLMSMMMYAGELEYALSYKQQADSAASWKRWFHVIWCCRACILVHACIFASLWSLAIAWTYLLWPVAYLTTYSLFSRIRNAAEHAAVPDINSQDARKNTRTTLARFWERLTVAPNYVNFHLEHHLFPHVPPYHLPTLYQYLSSRQAYGPAIEIRHGYGDVLRKLVIPT